MNRVDFINKTCMDDMVRKSVLEVFWDQFMLVCELSDSVEEIVPIPIAVDTGRIAFQIIHSDAESVMRMRQVIDANPYFTLYERQFRATYQTGTNHNIITVIIE